MSDQNISEITIQFNSIEIIESLPECEKQTGTELFCDIVTRLCDKHGYGKNLHRPSSKKEFLDVFNSVSDKVHKSGLMPILHFEIHGSREGFELKNGEKIVWQDIQDYCRLINIKTKNQLLITLATCWGSGIINMIDISKPAPYWGYIGPKEEILNGSLMEDFSEFYSSLLSEHNLNKAIESFKYNNRRDKYVYLHCKGIFEYLIENELKGKSLDKDEKFKRLFSKTKLEYPNLNRSDRRKKLKNNILKFDRNKFIEQMKASFLMI